MTTAADVLAGRATWSCEAAAWEQFLPGLPDDSVDLLVTSGPYEAARTYGVGFTLAGEAWVEWMVRFVKAAAPKVRGLMAINCEGQTRDYSYSAVPYLLAADLKRAGFNLRRPVVFHRVGIPGSGGPDWLRGDTELVICVTRPGRLPWSDNTACGHPPKWAPGGEMAYRGKNGTRANGRDQWGANGNAGTHRKPDGTREKGGRPGRQVLTAPDPTPQLFDGPAEVATAAGRDKWGMQGGVGMRRANGKRRTHGAKTATKGHADGDTKNGEYDPPVLANPGCLLQQTYTADEVEQLLADAPDVLHAVVGGGCMGHAAAHDNEAPFPVELPAFFVKSFAPPGGVVLDPFAGSGTTAQAAVENGRRFIGCDVRASQVDLTKRRMRSVTGSLPGVA